LANTFGRNFPVLDLAFALWLAPASGAGSSGGAPEVRAPIERQLEAFARDDAVAAYALAAPALKTIFRDPDIFLAMVRGRYAPVYRHRSLDFGEIEVDGKNASQALTIVDNHRRPEGALQACAPA
jgi:hypothetical protein